MAGRATGCTLNMFKPLSERSIRLATDYDFDAICTQLAKNSHLPYEEKLDFMRKNMERFKMPNAFGRFPGKGKAKAKVVEEEKGSDVQDEDEEEVTKQEEEEKVSDVEDEVEEDTESDDEDDGGDENEETLKLMVDDDKPATDGQLQVPTEGEPECKKPRLA